MLSGPLLFQPVLERVLEYGGDEKYYCRLLKRLFVDFSPGSRPSVRQLADWLERDKSWRRAKPRTLGTQRWSMTVAEIAPASGVPSQWDIPPLCTEGELAEWLGVEYTQLEWLCQVWGGDNAVDRACPNNLSIC